MIEGYLLLRPAFGLIDFLAHAPKLCLNLRHCLQQTIIIKKPFLRDVDLERPYSASWAAPQSKFRSTVSMMKLRAQEEIAPASLSEQSPGAPSQPIH